MNALGLLRGTPTQSELPIGVVMTVLENERRRLTVDLLADAESGTVRELADWIAMECDDDYDAVRKSIYVTLIQRHLPLLDKHEIVEYDDNRKTVETNTHFEPVADLLEHARERFEPGGEA